jgi:hypothetical protein
VSGRLHKSVKLLSGLLTLGLLAAWPLSAQAEGITFRNDLKTPIIVQGASLFRGVLVKGQPIVIQPGQTAVDAKLTPGIRKIVICDANVPGRVLHRQNIQFNGNDLNLTVTTTPTGTIGLVPTNNNKK